MKASRRTSANLIASRKDAVSMTIFDRDDLARVTDLSLLE